MTKQKKTKANGINTLCWLAEVLFRDYSNVLPRKVNPDGFHGEMRRMRAVADYDKVRSLANQLDRWYASLQVEYPTLPLTRAQFVDLMHASPEKGMGRVPLSLDDLVALGDTAALAMDVA